MNSRTSTRQDPKSCAFNLAWLPPHYGCLKSGLDITVVSLSNLGMVLDKQKGGNQDAVIAALVLQAISSSF